MSTKLIARPKLPSWDELLNGEDLEIGSLARKKFRDLLEERARKWFWADVNALSLGSFDEERGNWLGISRTSVTKKTLDFTTWLIGYYCLELGPWTMWRVASTDAWLDTINDLTGPYFRDPAAPKLSEDQFYDLCDLAGEIQDRYHDGTATPDERAFVVAWLSLIDWLPYKYLEG